MKTGTIITLITGFILLSLKARSTNTDTPADSGGPGGSTPIPDNTINVADDLVNAAQNAFGFLTFEQVDSVSQIVNNFELYGDGDFRKLAYIIATAWHESRLKPVRECFASTDGEARQCVSNANRSYAIEINGHVYYGRGFVQLTWLNNYQKMTDAVGVDFVNNPDLVIDTYYASIIINYGMMNGSFTGKDLSDYINDSNSDYYNARRTVNGTDRADLIANYTYSLLDNMTIV